MQKFVFHDPSGRRAQRANLALGLTIAAVIAVFAAFSMTLALAPRIPSVSFRDPRVLTGIHTHPARVKRHRLAWTHLPKPPTVQGAGVRPLTVGFFVSWDDQARKSLKDHLAELDVVSPQWVSLNNALGSVAVTDDPRAESIMLGSKKKPPTILPLVHNAHNGVWDGRMADTLLADPKARQALINTLIEAAAKRGYGGYVLDLENLGPKGVALYPGFVDQARKAFAATGREIWVTAPIDDDAWPLKTLSKAASTIVLMAYDEHYLTSEPGSPAGQAWYQDHLAESLKGLDPNRVVVALGSYGYDWSDQNKESAEAVSFHDAVQSARDSGVGVTFDTASLNPTFRYHEDDGSNHTVWFLDAATMLNEVKVADRWRPRGYALWRLGFEDPGVWNVLGRPFGQPADPAALQAMPAPTAVDYDGNGEIMKITGTPTPGRRTLATDPVTGLVTEERYDAIPSPYVVQRLGRDPKRVALTFDDGPDVRWTPKILDILKQKQAKATFFVIGENMETWPELVEREVREGQLVGSHTYTHPNIATRDPTTIKLELNLTQRLFQVITGRTMRFFRPPYLGDADPSTVDELKPLLLAQGLGYVPVGLRIDPDDWKKPDAKLIVQRVLDRLEDDNPDTGGNIVLLHDSGGDRSQTIKALPALIDALRAHGYELATVAELTNLTPAQAMPPTSAEKNQLILDRIAFDIVRNVNRALAALFMGAISLGLIRLIFLAVLAILHRIRAPGRTPPAPAGTDGPLVSVLIPCFNEEAVIVASVDRILRSTWANLEVLVLDDGSSDRTAERVRERFGAHPRVRLLSFENGGKALALNRGLALAKGEVIVALDADTQFAPQTIALLTRWFRDPAVGAVAGNAIVGNTVNLLTRWQALEYVTAQNLERRALSTLSAVTVVPGAVGAWRRTAIEAEGGFPHDTLAEDQDLTIALQRAGWKIEFDPEARAYTEAPETLRAFLKQRFRWSFGTLQCAWKHRRGLFSRKNPALGFIALPQIWLFQIVLALISPLVDLAVVYAVVIAVFDRLAHPAEWNSDNLVQMLFYWGAFVLFDISAAAIGFAMESSPPWRSLVWLPVQRFGYRQIMYNVVIKATNTAIRGPRVGWGKLERTANVTVAEPRPAAATGH